jgi:ribonuclease R
VSWLKAHYMQQHLGEDFDGVITAVTDFGLFVTLSALYVEGMVHISQLGNDYFVYDASSQSLVGQQHGHRFALGDRIKVKVAGVHLEDRKIDFALIKQLSSAGRPVRDKAPRTQQPSATAANRKPKVATAVATAAKPSKATKQPKAAMDDKPKKAKKPRKKTKKPNAKPKTKE